MVDAATIGILGGMMAVLMTAVLTVMIHLDRAHRAVMKAGFEAVERRLDRQEKRSEKRFDQQDKHFEKRFDQQDKHSEKRFDQVDERLLHLTGIVIDLAKSVGELSGRVAVSAAPVEVLSAAE